MFAHETPNIVCSHCGGSLGEGWESNCNNGMIDLSVSCCSLDYLWGEGYTKKGYGFNHPAMTEKVNDFQNLHFKWDHKGKYRICRTCQTELIQIIGNFFKADLCYRTKE